MSHKTKVGNHHMKISKYSDPSYITGVRVNENAAGMSRSSHRTVRVESHDKAASVDIEVHELATRERLTNALKEIVDYLDDRWFDENIDGNVDFHEGSGNGANSYYFHTDDDIGVHEFSFTGEDVTEDDIRSAVDGMIAEMKENNLL